MLVGKQDHSETRRLGELSRTCAVARGRGKRSPSQGIDGDGRVCDADPLNCGFSADVALVGWRTSRAEAHQDSPQSKAAEEKKALGVAVEASRTGNAVALRRQRNE